LATPDRVAALIFNDTAPEANPEAGARMKRFSGANELNHDEALERVRAQYAEDCPAFGDPHFEKLVYRGYAQNEAGKYVRDFDQLTNVELQRAKTEKPTWWAEFRQIGVPIAILRGANSDYVTPEMAARMLAGNPNAALHTIPGCGHPVMLWEPEAFAAIDHLLERVDDAA
jgi:pimeloyl-ACP methyl ester carboxylesterase